jgi:hypothetical protein
MKLGRFAPVRGVMGDSAGHGEYSRDPTRPSSRAQALSPEFVQRFLALIEEVTDELMKGQDVDRGTCRADAIALLIATSLHVGTPAERSESPLMYLLLEEQQKAASPAGSVPAFMRA